MKVLLLGASGYMGGPLVTRLKENSFFSEVFTISRNEIELGQENHFICDIKNKEFFFSILKKVNPNIIIDLVNFSKEGSKRIIEAYNEGLLDSLNHYLVVSSFFVYQYFDLNIFREKKLDSSILNKKIDENYTVRKIQMECELYKSELFNISTIVRLPYVFSYDDRTGRFQNMCKISINSKRKFLDNKLKFSMISKSHAINGLSYLASHDPCGLTDLANTGCMSSFEISEIIYKENFASLSKDLSLVEDSPYMPLKNLCIETNKVPIKNSLIESLQHESKLYFKNLKSL
jgi:nucleoside-diphosphate-sugar epimerase